MSRNQRALWTFLFYTLIGPFLGALVSVLGSPVLMWANMAPFRATDHPPYDLGNVPSMDSLMPMLGQIAIQSYVWCAIPAALTAITLLPHIWRKGTVGWIEPAVGGALCLAAVTVLFRFDHGGLLAYMCFAAAVVAVFCWAVLRRAGVLPAPPAAVDQRKS